MSAISASAVAVSASPTTQTVQPLAQLRRGDTGRITEVAVSNADGTRLKALGLCAGRNLRVVSSGNPLIVSVLGARVGLSAAIAQHVSVQPY